MKIAVLMDRITPGASPKLMGREISVLQSLGHEVEGLSVMDLGLPTDAYQFQEYLSGLPVRYIAEEHPWLRRFDFRIPPFSFFAAFDVVAAYMMPRFLRQANQYDLIIAHTTISCWIAQGLQKRLGIPYVAYVWDPITQILNDIYRSKLPGPLWKLAFAYGRRLDRRIIDESLFGLAGSDTDANIIEHFTDRRLDVLYPGVDVPKSTPSKRGDYLLTIDRWDIGNNPTWLLEVLAGVSDTTLLKVAGFWWPASLQTKFRARVREMGLDERVQILGPVTERELDDLYFGARALIFPHREAINLPVMEAAAHGCPSVVQKGFNLFTDGVDAFLPDPGDSGAGPTVVDENTSRPADLTTFINATRSLINDERLAWDMGQRARALVTNYSWDAHGHRLAAMIETHT